MSIETKSKKIRTDEERRIELEKFMERANKEKQPWSVFIQHKTRGLGSISDKDIKKISKNKSLSNEYVEELKEITNNKQITFRDVTIYNSILRDEYKHIVDYRNIM